MLRTALGLALGFTLHATGAAAQPPDAPPPPPVVQTAPPPVRPQGQSVNIRVDITITDQRADAPSAPKTVTLVVADRELGRIRTGAGQLMLNVDARPTILRDGRVSTHLTLEYRPRKEEPERFDPPSISESLTAILDDGKVLAVSQSADPASDRKVRVELKATILK
jgi:hypothetical protein